MNTIQQHDERPLAGTRVLDLIDGPMAVMGRRLAELGADVIRIEPPQGTNDRCMEPCVCGVSVPFMVANLGKHSLTLDVDGPDLAKHLEPWLDCADLLLYSPRNGTLDPQALRARYPRLIIMSVSDFGQNTAQRNWQATDPVFLALSGGLSRSGLPGREPLLPPAELAYASAAEEAVYVALLAYFNRLRNGKGDWLDFSVLDGVAHAFDPSYGIAGSATGGVPASQWPRGRVEARFYYPIIPCKDGYVRICVLAPRQWQGMFTWMGSPQEFSDSAYNSLAKRYASTTLIPAIARFFAGKTRVELEREGQSFGVPIAAVLSVDEALASEQVKAREALIEVEIAKGVSMRCPGGVFKIDGCRANPMLPTSMFDEHKADLRSVPEPVWSLPHTQAGTHPLSGIRVLDLGVIVVGAEQGRLLADQGADVVKLETSTFPDGTRQSLNNAPLSVAFAAGHRNKRGLSLNLRSEQGKALFLELVKRSDILLSNFKPGTLAALGLDEGTLFAANPSLIAVDSSAFGADGPWNRRLGYGPLVRASSGLTSQWRYADDPASFSDAIIIYPDHVAGRLGAIGALALLIRRLRTGRGGTVSIAQMEVILAHKASEIASRCLIGHAPVECMQNVPWGVYACAGEDEWCVVTVRSDADWQRLCQVIGRTDLADDPALSTRQGRTEQRARVEDALGAWLVTLSPCDAMQRLQAAGVPAGAMLRAAELPEFSYYRERDFFRSAEHPLLADPFLQENAPVRSQHLPDPPYSPAPIIAQHSKEIMREWLQLDMDAIGSLLDEGVLELATSPPPVA